MSGDVSGDVRDSTGAVRASAGAGGDARVVLVTGAAKGIGRSVARAFGADGARVVMLDRDGPALGSAAAETGAPDRVLSLVTDVTDETAVQRSVDQAIATFGRLDVVCNNAGVQAPGRLDTVTTSTWQGLLAVDLTAVFFVMRAAYPHLVRARGCVVNIASIDGLIGEASVGPYSAAKAGVVNLTRAAALDWGPVGIRVNAVCPGMTDTPMLRGFLDRSPDPAADLAARLRRVPLGRLVESDEVADAVCFLASDCARAITGTTLVVDGGVSAGWDFQAP